MKEIVLLNISIFKNAVANVITNIIHVHLIIILIFIKIQVSKYII